MKETVSILDGSTFVVSGENGNITAQPDQPEGLFFKDTRHLSLWTLTLNNIELDVLSTDTLEYYVAQFFCVTPTGTIYENPSLSVVRRRSVSDGFVERVALVNHSQKDQAVELDLRAAADFADLFEVKDALKKQGKYYQKVQMQEVVLGYKRGDFLRETVISASVVPTEIGEGRMLFRFNLPPKQLWELELKVRPVTGEAGRTPKSAPDRGTKQLRENLARWMQSAPTVISFPDHIRQLYMRSMVDVAALQFTPENLEQGQSIPAAGLPWFMAMFGRDSIITSYQALPFVPALAATTLRALASLQGKVQDDFREEEPGKILHELRFGELTHFKERPQSPYYGASDTTPLFLVLLDEYERWTGDQELVRELEPNARAALDWIDKWGDSDGDGYIEYKRKHELGLENQCWKDSWNSVLFADGTVAEAPRALCEIQGYAYDAKVRCSRLAREIWRDPELAARLDRDASKLKERFNTDFFIPERGFFAEALDGKKRKVDSLTSNIGHLLWSGIVDEDKAPLLARHLLSPEMFSGWGIRTMASTEGGYNPIEYHNGTVWPHDSSIIAAGLARYGFNEEAGRVITAIMVASIFFRYRLPEVFAGYDRTRTGFPVRYPTASSPQAWAAGAPLLGLRVLLGLDVRGEKLESRPVLPEWVGTLTLENIPGRWGRARASAERRDSPSYQELFERVVAQRSGVDAIKAA